MTNTWKDIKNADVILIMGGNAAEAHPVRLQVGDRGQDQQRRQADRGRSALHALRRRWPTSTRRSGPGTDIAFLSGVMRYLLANDKIQHEYVRAYTNASLHRARRASASRTGCSPAIDDEKHDYDRSSWDYELDERRLRQGRPDAAAPALRAQPAEAAHVDRYTPEMVERITGTPKDKFLAGLRADRRDRGARHGDDQHVRARLDAAFRWARRTSAPWR